MECKSREPGVRSKDPPQGRRLSLCDFYICVATSPDGRKRANRKNVHILSFRGRIHRSSCTVSVIDAY